MFSLLIRQPAKGNAVINGNLANGVNGVLDMRFVGFLFGHGNFPSLDHKCGVAVFCETAVNKNALYFCITGNNCRKGQAP